MLVFLLYMPVYALVLEDLIEHGLLEITLKNKKIGYYVGSFDPLHKGHERVAQLPIKQGLCDFVIIYPAWGGDSYKKRVDVSMRLDMLFATFQDHPHVIVTRLAPKKLQETLTVVDLTNNTSKKKFVKPLFEGMSFIGIIGSDVALKLESSNDTTFMTGLDITPAYQAHTVGGCMALPVATFIVVAREGDDVSLLHGAVRKRKIQVINEHASERVFSSTAVKKAIKNNESIDSMVNKTTRSIIGKHGLYR